MRLETNVESDPTGEDTLNVPSPWVEIQVRGPQNANAVHRKFLSEYNLTKSIPLESSCYRCRSFPHADRQLSVRCGNNVFGV